MQMLKAKLYLLKQQENAEKAIRYPRRSERDRLGQSDPFLCHAAVYDGQGSPYRMQETGNVNAVSWMEILIRLLMHI